MQRLIQQNDDIRRDWLSINWCIAQIESLQKQLASLASENAALRTRLSDMGDPMHPFRIYRLPRTLRQSAALDKDTDWRKVRVRAGRVARIVVDGTDNCDDNPDSARCPLLDDNGQPIQDIVVPDNVLAYWFWIEISSAHAVLKHSANPAGAGWTSFPDPDVTHIPVGYVDTATFNSTHQIVIRQLLRTDLIGVATTICLTDESGNMTQSSMLVQGVKDPAAA